MKEIWRLINKFYLANFILVFSIIFTITTMFLVQFQVENTKDKIHKMESDISAAHDQIQLLEVEWVYLTRPGRLRDLSSKFLKNNGYALASQIKDRKKLEEFYYVNYQKLETPEFAENKKSQTVIKVSF